MLVCCACGEEGPFGPASNRAPQVRSVTVTPTVVPLGGTATIKVDAVDPDGDDLFFHYDAGAGTITRDEADASRATYRNDGVVRPADRITVTVMDASSAVTRHEVPVSLQGNRAPEVRITGPRDCHPNPVCNLDLAATAEDPDGDTLSYVWSGCASGSDRTARCSLAAAGHFVAVVTVQDTRGGTTTVSVGLDGTNARPVVRGGQVFKGVAPVRFLVTEEDADNDTLTCGWWGNCQCAGSHQSYNLVCSLPAELASCFMR
ncbi:MAG TPA: hypothetical protein VF310_03550, partial [Vicinamibacteria bacterium]